MPQPRLPFLPALLLVLLAAALHSPADAPASHGEENQTLDLLHTIEVQLGDEENRMRFFPGRIQLYRGETYNLVLTNPSPVTHEFASEALASHIETEKLEIFDESGKLVAYVRGDIVEVELQPGGRIEWLFTTHTSGERIDLFCDIPGHRDAGMVGEIAIREP